MLLQHQLLVTGFGNSLLYTVVGTVINLVMTVLAAYPLSRKDLAIRNPIMLLFTFTMLFNGGLVPSYIMYSRYLHMKNTILALIIPGLLMNAFNVILIRSYFQNNVPLSLVEAAQIDGASEFQVVLKVVLPMSKPIIATIGLFIGVAYWNDWQNGLYYVTDEKIYSIQQILNNMLKNIEYLSKNATSVAKSTSTPTNSPVPFL